MYSKVKMTVSGSVAAVPLAVAADHAYKGPKWGLSQCKVLATNPRRPRNSAKSRVKTTNLWRRAF